MKPIAGLVQDAIKAGPKKGLTVDEITDQVKISRERVQRAATYLVRRGDGVVRMGKRYVLLQNAPKKEEPKANVAGKITIGRGSVWWAGW